jgi:hypothetical protein
LPHDRDLRLLERLSLKLDELSRHMERMKLAEYVAMLQRPRRLLYLNFVSGLARGLGFAVGFTILGAVVLYALQRALMLNLPVIGGFIAEIVRIVEERLARNPPSP